MSKMTGYVGFTTCEKVMMTKGEEFMRINNGNYDDRRSNDSVCKIFINNSLF